MVIEVFTGYEDWYTPPEIVALAREYLGIEQFDFDPASCAPANALVGARRYLTKADDALASTTPWSASDESIWMNPPYKRKVIDQFVARFLHEVNMFPYKKAAVLVNAATSSGWWQELARNCSLCVVLSRRVSFIDGRTGLPRSGNAMGQTLFLFNNVRRGITVPCEVREV